MKSVSFSCFRNTLYDKVLYWLRFHSRGFVSSAKTRRSAGSQFHKHLKGAAPETRRAPLHIIGKPPPDGLAEYGSEANWSPISSKL